jgi:serine/threonine protein kinase
MTLQRTVALKIINFGIAARSAQARQRFLREARSAAALRHENIATVFQFGIREETGQCFYAMELIDGETLEQRVRRTGPLSEPAAIHLAQQVASALAAAEKRGLIHRDLKPANLMLVSSDDQTPSASRQRCDYNNARELVATPRNHRARRDAIGANDTDQKPLVKIIDFGLAKALNAPVGPTRLTHNSFVGTPVFASPEQFNHSRLDVRSDIYSLGVTLWFALTGKTPFGRHSIEEIRRAQRGNALPIEQLKAARVRSSLRSLLKSMLEFESAARPGTHELAAKLQACAAQATGVRHPRIVLGAAALVLGISAFSFVAHLAGTRRLSLESGRRRERHCRAAD